MQFRKTAIVPALAAAFKIAEAGGKSQPPFDHVIITQKLETLPGKGTVHARNFFGESLRVNFDVLPDEDKTQIIAANKTFFEYIQTAEPGETIKVNRREGQGSYQVSFGHSTGTLNTDIQATEAILEAENQPSTQVNSIIITIDKKQLAESLRVGMIRKETDMMTDPFSYVWIDKSRAVAGCNLYLTRHDFSEQETENLFIMLNKIEPLTSLLQSESGEVKIELLCNESGVANRAIFTGDSFEYGTTVGNLKIPPYQSVMDKTKADIVATIQTKVKDIEAVLTRTKSFGRTITLEVSADNQINAAFFDQDRGTRANETLKWECSTTAATRAVLIKQQLSRLLRSYDKEAPLTIEIQRVAEGEKITKKAVFISSGNQQSAIMPMKGEG